MGEYGFEAEELAKRFGRTTALDGVSLAVPRGQVLGLLGPNGAGKTTVIRILATLLRPDGGRAEVAGFDVVRRPGEVRRRIALSGQHTSVDEELTGLANLVMIGQLLDLPRQAAVRRAGELLTRFDLTDAAGRPVAGYSGGMRRRLDLAASLVGRPEVMFLDEPCSCGTRTPCWPSVSSHSCPCGSAPASPHQPTHCPAGWARGRTSTPSHTPWTRAALAERHTGWQQRGQHTVVVRGPLRRVLPTRGAHVPPPVKKWGGRW